MLLLPLLLTWSVYWLAGGTENVTLRTHTSTLMLSPPARHFSAAHILKGNKLMTWRLKRRRLSFGRNLKQHSNVHGRELFVLPTAATRPLLQYGCVSDSGLTSCSCGHFLKRWRCNLCSLTASSRCPPRLCSSHRTGTPAGGAGSPPRTDMAGIPSTALRFAS